MATYNNAANCSTQQDNDSWENLPNNEVDCSPACTSSTRSTASTGDVTQSRLEKLKARLLSAKEARDSRASLYEVWESKLPRYYANQTYPTVESYPPHRAEYARQMRHQSWYPHYKMSSKSSANSCAEPDASKVEELMKERRHQSWYPHYKIEC
jgi:hypothetical protein